MKKRLLIYNTCVKSVLLYNCETWGLTKTNRKQLDSFHRQQLRKVLNIRYPNKISSLSVYERCDACPISLEILERRWRFFGHILRLDERTPCWKAMKTFFDTSNLQKFRGRPRTTIQTTINEDLKRLTSLNPVYSRNQEITTLETLTDLYRFRLIAQNRNRWKNLTNCIYTAAKAEESNITDSQA